MNLPLPGWLPWLLIAIGVWGIRRSLVGRVHAHVHRHGEVAHTHVHAHEARTDPDAHAHGHAAFAIGTLHGNEHPSAPRSAAPTIDLRGATPVTSMPWSCRAVCPAAK